LEGGFKKKGEEHPGEDPASMWEGYSEPINESLRGLRKKTKKSTSRKNLPF